MFQKTQNLQLMSDLSVLTNLTSTNCLQFRNALFGIRPTTTFVYQSKACCWLSAPLKMMVIIVVFPSGINEEVFYTCSIREGVIIFIDAATEILLYRVVFSFLPELNIIL